MKEKNKTRYSDKKLKKFKKIIQKRLKREKEELGTLRGFRRDQRNYIAQADMSFSDDSRRFQRRSIMDSMITRMKSNRKNLRNALVRIENKTYGICTVTGKLISEERLIAKPTARKSMKAKSKKKK